jgi:dehydratase
MTHSPTRRIAARFGVVAVALGAVLATASPASAEPQTIVYPCQATTGLGVFETSIDQVVDGTAPATVAPGGNLTVTIVPAPDQVPTTSLGFPITEARDFRLVFPVPANSTLVSASLSGGEGLGAEPVLTVEGDTVVATLDSSLAGGASYTLPTLTMELTAAQEGTIDVVMGGTSYTDPGLSMTIVVDVLGTPLEAATACYPSPNPVLASTTITP